MRFLSLLIVLLSFSCKEDCRICRTITETNITEAQMKCNGYANDHPLFIELSRSELGCLTEDEISNISQTKIVSGSTLCDDVQVITRIRRECD